MKAPRRELLTAACHDLYERSINWCAEREIPLSLLSIVLIKGYQIGEVLDAPSDILSPPVLFADLQWSAELRRLIVEFPDRSLVARLYFSSIDEAKVHGFPGRIVLLNSGIVLDFSEQDLLYLVAEFEPLFPNFTND